MIQGIIAIGFMIATLLVGLFFGYLYLLKRQGYRIVASNYSCSIGELDLVAVHGRSLVFVEVRSTDGEDSSRPAESVDQHKQRRLTELALIFLSRYRLLDHPARFDILAVSWPPNRTEPRIDHFPNAFQPVGRFQMFT